MAMTEALAATGAQTIPIFALGGVIEARVAMQIKREQQAPRMPILWASLQTIWVTVLFATGGIDLGAEAVCLLFLAHVNFSAGADTLVIAAMMASLAVLAMFPLISLAARAQWFWAKSNLERLASKAVEDALETVTAMIGEQLRQREKTDRRD